MACLADKPDCVTALLMAGADCNISASKISPDEVQGPPGYVGDYIQVYITLNTLHRLVNI